MDNTTLPKTQGKRILIVEDEKEYRDILTEILQEEGFTVFQAENGQIALNLLLNKQVDLILLDMLMPQMDGITFFNHLKKTLNRNTPVIILTNFTEAAHPAGVTDVVIKANTSLDEVLRKVKKNLSIQA